MTIVASPDFRDAVKKTSPRQIVGIPQDNPWGYYPAEQQIEKKLLLKQTLLTAFLSTGMCVGTGGIANACVMPIPHESPTYHISFVQPRRVSQLVDTSERLAALRRYFSLNITDLAKVLRVERPTIYSWLQENAAPHSGNLRRIEKIYQLARDWRAMSAAPVGKYVHQPLENSQSLLNYLSAEELNETAIQRAFALIKSQLTQDKRTSRRSVAEVAQFHGFPPTPEHIQKKNFDEETNL